MFLPATNILWKSLSTILLPNIRTQKLARYFQFSKRSNILAFPNLDFIKSQDCSSNFEKFDLKVSHEDEAGHKTTNYPKRPKVNYSLKKKQKTST